MQNSTPEIQEIESILKRKYAIDIQNDVENIKNEKIKKVKKNLLNYFGMSPLDIKTLGENLDISGLDLFLMLGGYKEYISKNLSKLDENILAKIKKSICIKIGLINHEIELLKEQEMKRFLNLSRMRENRWIINIKIKEIFFDVNEKILPSAYFLANLDKESASAEFIEKGSIIEAIFQSPFNEKGSFGENFFGKRKLLSYGNKNESIILEQMGFVSENIKDISLLSQKDRNTEEDVMMWYMATLGVLIANDLGKFNPIWTGPGCAIGLSYAIGDTFSDEDFALKLLKNTNNIPKDFRMDKQLSDRIIAAMTIIPGVFTISKSKKIADYVSNLTPEKKEKFKVIQEKIKSLLKKGPGILKKNSKIMKKDNVYINSIVKGLKEGSSIKIGMTQIAKLENSMFKLSNEKKIFTDKPLSDIQKIIEGLNEEDKNNYVLEQRISFFISKLIGNKKEIFGHTVEVQLGGIYIIYNQKGDKLNEHETKNFIHNNLNDITLAFFSFDLIEGGQNIKKYIADSMGEKTLSSYIKEDMMITDFTFNEMNFLGIQINENTQIKDIIEAFDEKKWSDICSNIVYSNETYSLLQNQCLATKENLLGNFEDEAEQGDILNEFNDIGMYIYLSVLNSLIQDYILGK